MVAWAIVNDKSANYSSTECFFRKMGEKQVTNYAKNYVSTICQSLVISAFSVHLCPGYNRRKIYEIDNFSRWLQENFIFEFSPSDYHATTKNSNLAC